MTSSNIEIRMNECSTKCILLKTNGKWADQAGWKKAHFWLVPLLFACNDFIFAYDEDFMCCWP